MGHTEVESDPTESREKPHAMTEDIIAADIKNRGERCLRELRDLVIGALRHAHEDLGEPYVHTVDLSRRVGVHLGEGLGSGAPDWVSSAILWELWRDRVVEHVAWGKWALRSR